MLSFFIHTVKIIVLYDIVKEEKTKTKNTTMYHFRVRREITCV